MEGQSFWQRLDTLARHMVPALTGLVAVLVMAVPAQTPALTLIAPWLSLAVVYYWIVYRPDLMNAVVVFGIAVIQDLLLGPWPGLNSLVFLAVYGIVLLQRRLILRGGFPMLWFSFAWVGLGAEVGAWLAMSLLNLQAMPVTAPLFRVGMTVAVFPVVAWVLMRIHRLVLAYA